MRIELSWGQTHAKLEVPADQFVAVRRQPSAPPLADVAAAVRDALEQPLGFPPLRRALTPDDHIAVVVDESLADLSRLLPPILTHLKQANIQMDAVTLVCAPPSTGQPWLEDLPDEFQDVHVEVHQPDDRKKLAYLAATRQGKRIYLNRTVVDADQSVVLTRRGYDCLLGYAGGEGSLYPSLGDEAMRREAHQHLSLAAPDADAWKLRGEAGEVAWLLGAPFFVQVIEGAGDQLAHVLGGPLESAREGDRLLDARWRVEVAEPADVVIATISGDPSRHTFADMARAFGAASRVIEPGGTIILLTDANPPLGPSAGLLRQRDDAAHAMKLLLREDLDDLEAGYQWASAAQKAKLYLLSRMPTEVAEELFTTPLDTVDQVKRLVRGRCLMLPDAHRMMAVVKS